MSRTNPDYIAVGVLILTLGSGAVDAAIRLVQNSVGSDFPGYAHFSNNPAAPCPPPTHIVTTPYRALRRNISLAMVPTIREPVMPKGWPMEIDPPFTLSLSIGMPKRSRQ